MVNGFMILAIERDNTAVDGLCRQQVFACIVYDWLVTAQVGPMILSLGLKEQATNEPRCEKTGLRGF